MATPSKSGRSHVTFCDATPEPFMQGQRKQGLGHLVGTEETPVPVRFPALYAGVETPDVRHHFGIQEAPPSGSSTATSTPFSAASSEPGEAAHRGSPTLAPRIQPAEQIFTPGHVARLFCERPGSADSDVSQTPREGEEEQLQRQQLAFGRPVSDTPERALPSLPM